MTDLFEIYDEYILDKRDENYSENTVYMAGLYKALSIVVDSIEEEYKALNKWADEESKQIND